jgi:FkbM family methyltransferase
MPAVSVFCPGAGMERGMSLIPIETMAAQYGIQIRGVIQIGAHSGQEVPELIKNGVGRIHLVEANSDLIPGLQAMASSFEGQITISNVAISDANGYEDFHVTSFSQSSSLLPLADHKIVYPKITEVTIVKVRTETLDGNVTANNLDLRAFNALFIDVQGAELKVLRGAKETLSHLDIVITEVNFEELYQGCPQIEDLDLFLFDAGFARVATVTPYHDSWGDALYIRTSRLSNPALLSLPKRHKVSMPSLGANGRFANQLFQYLFLSLYALRSSCEPVFPEFEAACFFEVPFKPGRTSVLAPMSEVARGDAAIFLEAQEPPRDIELWGYFQDITNAHLRHRELAVRLLTPKPEYKSALDEWWVKVREKCGRVIGLHIRRGGLHAV